MTRDLYGVPFVSKFITDGHLENTVGIYKSSGHLCKCTICVKIKILVAFSFSVGIYGICDGDY